MLNVAFPHRKSVPPTWSLGLPCTIPTLILFFSISSDQIYAQYYKCHCTVLCGRGTAQRKMRKGHVKKRANWRETKSPENGHFQSRRSSFQIQGSSISWGMTPSFGFVMKEIASSICNWFPSAKGGVGGNPQRNINITSMGHFHWQIVVLGSLPPPFWDPSQKPTEADLAIAQPANQTCVSDGPLSKQGVWKAVQWLPVYKSVFVYFNMSSAFT